MLPAVVVAYVVFVLIRSHVCERYRVPSSSMEPTLHGAEVGGDVVLVDKTAWWSWRQREPDPWDLVVVRNRHRPGGDHIVKRFVAAGKGWVALREGDAFAGRDPSDLRRLQKDLTVARGMRATAFEFPASPARDYFEPAADVWTESERAIRLRCGSPDAMQAALTASRVGAARDRAPRDLPAHLSTASQIDTSFLDSRGRRLARLRGVPRDIGAELEVRPEPGCRALQLVLEEFQVYYAFVYGVDGRGTFRIVGTDGVADDEVQLSGPPLRPGQATAVAFGYVDGRVFLEVGGDAVHFDEVELVEPPPLQLPGYDPRFRNLLHVGAIGAVDAAVDSAVVIPHLTVFHDIYYAPDRDRVFRLDEGQVFLLGDHTFDSTDSRDHPTRPFELGDLIGRPVAIIGPPQRTRWLPR